LLKKDNFDQSLPERTNLSIENIIALLQFILSNNFFVFQGDHFKQIFGCPMRSPVSAILANLVMEYVKEKALLSDPNSPNIATKQSAGRSRHLY